MLAYSVFRGFKLALRRHYVNLRINPSLASSTMVEPADKGSGCKETSECSNIEVTKRTFFGDNSMAPTGTVDVGSYQTSDSFPVVSQLLKSSVISGFEVLDNIEVKELSLTVVRLRHLRTKAEHLHIKNNDRNNVFLIGVTTPPEDDSGAAHMLEHIVLCGSKAFDVKDPFFLMRVRTLSNFMNAYTAYGHTGYVYATHNPRDYVNLQSMYLDAVLHPLFRTLDFHQEAWRYDKSNSKDSSAIEFRGVVYSEMMGVYSDPGSHFSRLLMTNAYSFTPYRYDPGGFPASIPDIDLHGLTEYHHKHYHPSKFRTISYGCFNLEEVLCLVDKKYQDFNCDERANATGSLPSSEIEIPNGSINLTAPLDMSMGSEEHNHSVLISYRLGKITDFYKDQELYSILEFYLFGGAHSPIHQKIIDTGLAKGFVVISGVFNQIPLVSFVVGLRGVKECDVQIVIDSLKVIFDTIAAEGIDEIYIKSFYHRALVETKTITGKFGLNLSMSVLSDWVNGVDIFKVLDYKSKFDTIEKALKDKDVLKNITKESFIENPHVLTQVITHSSNFDDPISKEKMAKMAAERYNSTLSDSERTVYDKEVTVDLPEYQGRETYRRGDLPIVSKGDLPDHLEMFPVEIGEFNLSPSNASEPQKGVDFYSRFVSTNGFVYIYLRFDLSDIIPYDLLSYLNIYAKALGTIGLEDLSAALLSAKANLLFSKFSLSPVCIAPQSDREARNIYMNLGVGCLRENVPEAINLMLDILYKTDWNDRSTLEQVLRELHDDINSHLLSDGSDFAISASNSVTNIPSLKCNDSINGILYAQNISGIFDGKGNILSFDAIVSKLRQIGHIMTEAAGMRFYVISEGESDLAATKDEITKAYKKHGVANINSTPVTPNTTGDPPTPPVVTGDPPGSLNGNSYYIVDSSVAFTSITLIIPNFDNEDSAALDLICSLMDSLYVHKNIREKLSSYGSGCLFNSRSGTITLYSYRTPSNVVGEVLDALLKGIEWAKDLNKIVNNVFMHEAILSVIKRVDSPVAPKDQGISQFYYDTKYEISDKRRSKLLVLSVDDLQSIVNKYFSVLPIHTKAVVGSSESLKILRSLQSHDEFVDVRSHFAVVAPAGEE